MVNIVLLCRWTRIELETGWRSVLVVIFGSVYVHVSTSSLKMLLKKSESTIKKIIDFIAKIALQLSFETFFSMKTISAFFIFAIFVYKQRLIA